MAPDFTAPTMPHLRGRPRGRGKVARLRRGAVHLAVLWGFAVAQPLLDLLGDAPEFFVARGNTRSDILVLAIVYGLLPPLVGAAAVWAAGRLRPALGWGLMLALVALLVAAFALPPLGDLLGGSALAVALAAAEIPPERFRALRPGEVWEG